MQFTPTVSIVMPIYKVERYVGAAIQSVLEQTYANWELIAVDDCSPDASGSKAARFEDSRIRLIRHETNRGQGEARNTGIRAARGGYIAFLDSDDIATPTRLAEQVAFLEGNPRVGMVGSGAELIDDGGKPIGKRPSPYPNELLRPLLVFRNPFITSTLMLRREALPAELFQPILAEDYDFLSRIPEPWSLANLTDYLVRYRINPQGSMGTRWEQIKLDCWKTQQRLLDQLGLPLSEVDEILHRRICHATTDGIDATDARLAANWMQRILAANQTARVYDPKLLQEVCGHVLYSLWRSAPSGGAQTVLQARRTLLDIGCPPSVGQLARLTARALRHRWQSGADSRKAL